MYSKIRKNRILYDLYGETLAPTPEMDFNSSSSFIPSAGPIGGLGSFPGVGSLPWGTPNRFDFSSVMGSLGGNNPNNSNFAPPAQNSTYELRPLPLSVTVDVTLEEILGTTKTIEFERKLLAENFNQATAQICTS